MLGGVVHVQLGDVDNGIMGMNDAGFERNESQNVLRRERKSELTAEFREGSRIYVGVLEHLFGV